METIAHQYPRKGERCLETSDRRWGDESAVVIHHVIRLRESYALWWVVGAITRTEKPSTRCMGKQCPRLARHPRRLSRKKKRDSHHEVHVVVGRLDGERGALGLLRGSALDRGAADGRLGGEQKGVESNSGHGGRWGCVRKCELLKPSPNTTRGKKVERRTSASCF